MSFGTIWFLVLRLSYEILRHRQQFRNMLLIGQRIELIEQVKIGRTQEEREKGDDVQQRATGRIWMLCKTF